MAIVFYSSASLASNQSIVYQGRILRPDGTAPNSGTISFTLAVYSPSPKKCLLYSETQTVNMTGSGGMFSLALGAGTRSDSGSHAFSQIFVNGGTLSSSTCEDGSTSYSPAATDDRSLVASFNDNGTVVNLSSLSIKSVPFALQAAEIGGFGVNDIVKIHPTVGSATTFTVSEMAKAKVITSLSCAVNEVIKWNGTAWACSSDATGGSPSDASYLAKGIVQIDTDAVTSGLSVASGVLKLADVNTNVGTYGSATKTLTLTVNAQGRVTAASHQDIAIPVTQITQSGASNGEVLKWNGSAWAPAADAGTTTDATYAAKGIVQFDTNAATSGVSITSGVAKVNFGTGANQIVKLDGSGRLPAVDGSQLTNISASGFSGTLGVANGGTGQSTYTAGDILYATGASATSKLGIGASGTVLTSNGTNPVWGAIESLGFFKDGGNTFTSAAILGTNSNHNLEIETNGTTKMTIEAGGSVGIGIANPTSVFEVGGTSRALTNSQALVNFFSTDTQGADVGSTLGLGGQDGTSSRTFATIGGLKENSTSGDYGGYLGFATRPNGSVLVERMRIDSSGNVGIGKVPAGTSKLEVQGHGGSTGSLVKLLRSPGNANQFMEIHPGDVANSHHYITSQSYEAFKKKTYLSSVHDGSGAPTGELGFVFRTGPASAPIEVFKILESGYAGIGNITPSTVLDIDGAFTQRGMASPSVSPAGQGRIYFDSTANKFKVSQNGAAYVDLVNTSTGGVTGVTAGTGLLVGTTAGGTISTTGTLNINVGTGANQIVQLDGSARLPAVDGSALTNLSAANITAGTLPVGRGGTGLTAGTSGGIPYYSASNTMASSAALTANGVVLGGGAGAAPTATAAGAADSVLRVPSGGGAPAFGAIDLSQSAAVTGTLAIANGGTGASSIAANRLVGTNGTGTAQQAVTCSLNQVLSFDASGNYGCYNASTIFSGAFADGGNTFTAAATLGTNSNHSLAFETNGTARMTIGATGNVNLTPPTGVAALTLTPPTQSEDIFLVKNSTAGNAVRMYTGYDDPALKMFNASGTEIASLSTSSGGGTALFGFGVVDMTDSVTYSYGAGLYIRTPSGLGKQNGIFFGDGFYDERPGAAITFYDATAGVTQQGGLHFKTSNVQSTGAQTRMTLTEEGRLGIGTKTPSTLLAVGTESFTADVPQASPTARITLDNTYDSSGNRTANKIVLYDRAGWRAGFGVSDERVDSFSGGGFSFFTGHQSEATMGTHALTIGTAGNVGIGNTNPDSKLDVSSTETQTTASKLSALESLMSIEPTAPLASGANRSAVYGHAMVPGTVSNSVRNIHGVDGLGNYLGSGGANLVAGGNFYAYNGGSGANSQLIGVYAASDASGTGTVTNLAGVQAESYSYTGTVTNQYGVSVYLERYPAATVSNRYGIYFHSPYGTVTNDYSVYQEPDIPNYFKGNVGINDTTPEEKLKVTGSVKVESGQIYVAEQTSSAASPLTFNTNSGNAMLWTTNTVSPTVNVHNMKAGGAYTLTVNGTGTGTVTINCYSDAGTTALTSSFVPANGARTTGTANITVYNLIRTGNFCLVTWITGF